jgi:hypothetical protein
MVYSRCIIRWCSHHLSATTSETQILVELLCTVRTRDGRKIEDDTAHR